MVLEERPEDLFKWMEIWPLDLNVSCVQMEILTSKW